MNFHPSLTNNKVITVQYIRTSQVVLITNLSSSKVTSSSCIKVRKSSSRCSTSSNTPSAMHWMVVAPRVKSGTTLGRSLTLQTGEAELIMPWVTSSRYTEVTSSRASNIQIRTTNKTTKINRSSSRIFRNSFCSSYKERILTRFMSCLMRI